MEVLITGSGLYTPAETISNDELVESYNTYVDNYNLENDEAIKSGQLIALVHSDSEFIKKVSGIEQRFVLDKEGILDPARMRPNLKARSNEEISVQAEIAVDACKQAMENAGRSAKDIDAVICGCANLQRAYPAVSIEIQDALNIEGYAYDMNVACSSSTFAIQNAYNDIQSGVAERILVVNPDICSAHLNFKDRDGHFIFGDICTAVVIEKNSQSKNKFKILDTKLKTSFSNNIRNNYGYMNAIEDKEYSESELLFVQNGRRVFKEVMPFVSSLILDQLNENNLSPNDIEQYWLHQANINMNSYVIKKLLGDHFPPERAPIILDEYANTSSAGSIIAFHKYNHLTAGQRGIICSFGAGYSICSILLEKA